MRISVDAQRYVCFFFRGKLYRFLRLPMGAKLSPAFFCWLSAELTRILRAYGIDVIITYVDDLLIRAASVEAGEEALALLEALFGAANVAVKEVKTQHTSPTVKCIGFTVDSVTDTISIAPAKFFSTMVELAVVRTIALRGGDAYVPLDFYRSAVSSTQWGASITFSGPARMGPLWHGVHRARCARVPVGAITTLPEALNFWLTDTSIHLKGHALRRHHSDAAL